MFHRLGSAQHFIHFAGEHQFPSAVFEAGQRSSWSVRIESLVEELLPIVWSDGIQAAHNIFESVRDQLGAVALSAVKSPAEVVERFFPAGFAANDGIRLEPNERAFVVVIHAATPRRSRFSGSIQQLGCNGGVL